MPRQRTTRASVAHGRETVMSLTQTEIMLVLAVVVLLLLLAKNADLAAAEAERDSAKQQIAALEEVRDSAEALSEQREQADLAEEVKAILRRGPPTEDDAERPRLQPRDVAEIKKMVAERERHKAEQEVVDRALDRVNRPPGMSRQQQIERLGELAALGEAIDQSDTGSGDQVGFNPCWPGPGGAGQRRYYFVYDITFANGKYEIRPHRDWRDVPMVMTALAGRLHMLREHPREPVSADELRTFGLRMDAEVDRLRANGTYPPDCRLAVTLNEEASGVVIKFIRDEARFYPIAR